MIFDGTLLKSCNLIFLSQNESLFLVGCAIHLPNLGILTMVHYRAENRQVGEVYGTINQKNTLFCDQHVN